jgi:hypothetical protein
VTRVGWFVVVAWISLPTLVVGADGAISPQGKALGDKLDSLHVKKLWLSQRYVDWETGKEIHPDNPKKYTHSTHCSAFVAAACQRLGVYILRPPEHSEILLANAQFDWLQEKGKEHGWQPVRGAAEAQRLANQGNLVVATFKAADAKKPGHIAIVRPWVRTAAEIQKDGPEIIQAGQTNYDHASLRTGFSKHPGAWPDGVRYFVHRQPKLN